MYFNSYDIKFKMLGAVVIRFDHYKGESINYARGKKKHFYL